MAFGSTSRVRPGNVGSMIQRAIGMALAAALLPIAAPAAAQEPDNAVSCIYAGFSPEDREIALLLIAREISQGGKFSPSSRNVASVDALIDDGSAQCSARFHWSKARSDAARDYALTAFLGEAIDQSLQASARTIAPLEEYYRTNPGALSLRADGVKQLAEYLGAHGWEKAERQELVLAALYVDTLALKDQARTKFSAVRR